MIFFVALSAFVIGLFVGSANPKPIQLKDGAWQVTEGVVLKPLDQEEPPMVDIDTSGWVLKP